MRIVGYLFLDTDISLLFYYILFKHNGLLFVFIEYQIVDIGLYVNHSSDKKIMNCCTAFQQKQSTQYRCKKYKGGSEFLILQITFKS